MVLDHEAEHASRWAAVSSVAGKIGCTARTLNQWAKRFERDSAVRAGVIVVLIMRFRRRGCFLGGFSSVNYEISTGTLGQSLLVDCVALLLFQNSRSVRQ